MPYPFVRPAGEVTPAKTPKPPKKRWKAERCCFDPEHDAWLVMDWMTHGIDSVWHDHESAKRRAYDLNRGAPSIKPEPVWAPGTRG